MSVNVVNSPPHVSPDFGQIKGKVFLKKFKTLKRKTSLEKSKKWAKVNLA